MLQIWARLLGAALMAGVTFALPFGSHSHEAPHGQPQQGWCAFGEYSLNSWEDLGVLERAKLEPSVDYGATINIPVNVFILGDSATQSRLNLSSPVVRLQDNLAYGYSSLGYSFGPFNTYHVYDSKLAQFSYGPRISDELLKIARHLRSGGAETLNIYLVPKMTTGVLGFSLFPHILMRNTPDALAIDGVLFSYYTMTHYLAEKTTIHEVGHWLGLVHPFQGGCLVPDGDGVPDTPQAEFKNDQQCVAEKDTCPGLPGIDLVRNYMMYSSCTKNLTFTPGQISKMRQSWQQYRNPSTRKLPPSTNQPLRTVPDLLGNNTTVPFIPSGHRGEEIRPSIVMNDELF